MRGRWLIVCVVAVAASLATACRRGAEEPPSSKSSVPSAAQATASASSSTSAAAPGRCVFPTSEAPPPAVPAGPAPGCPVDPSPHTLEVVTVQFPEAREGTASVRAELARRSADSERGLMYRTSMDTDRGMLFDLGERSVHRFWMRNTCIPLDMLFLDDDGLVVGILENVPTLNDALRSVPCPSTHVLEVNAGWSRRHGVRAGQRAILPGA